MSDQWFRQWFPVVGMLFQVVLWGAIFPRIASPELLAIVTFSPLPSDPEF